MVPAQISGTSSHTPSQFHQRASPYHRDAIALALYEPHPSIMVSTRSSRRPSPPVEGPIDPLPARQPRRQTKARGKRSSVARGIDELDPELLLESSNRGTEPPASSPGSLAHRYGEPARRAAPVPTEAFSLSQLTARSSGQGKSWCDASLLGRLLTLPRFHKPRCSIPSQAGMGGRRGRVLDGQIYSVGSSNLPPRSASCYPRTRP